jgi:hypothetical protein
VTRAVPWGLRRADYRFLEEVGSTADAAKRVKPSDKRGSEASARTDLELLRREAQARGVELLFQPQGMERRRMNTSWYCKRCVGALNRTGVRNAAHCSCRARACVRQFTISRITRAVCTTVHHTAHQTLPGGGRPLQTLKPSRRLLLPCGERATRALQRRRV